MEGNESLSTVFVHGWLVKGKRLEEEEDELDERRRREIIWPMEGPLYLVVSHLFKSFPVAILSSRAWNFAIAPFRAGVKNVFTLFACPPLPPLPRVLFPRRF